MSNSTKTRPGNRAEREAAIRTARRAEQAGVVAGLKTILESDEQLLGFARGRIAGGFRGKLNIGPEAFFAPVVNIGLTERRFILQHIRSENGKPSEILPHFFDLSEILALTFADIETFGAEPACRLILRLNNELFCRLRLRGTTNLENARALAEVFTSLTASSRSATTPTQRTCSNCVQTLDQPYPYCPYCGAKQPETEYREERKEAENGDMQEAGSEFKIPESEFYPTLEQSKAPGSEEQNTAPVTEAHDPTPDDSAKAQATEPETLDTPEPEILNGENDHDRDRPF